VLANIERARTEDMKAMEERHHKLRRQDNAKYAECLAPLIDLRDKMRAEWEKKCEDAHRKAYAMGYAFADQRWNPVYMAVCEELEAARKEGANHQDAYIRVCKERDNAILAQVDLRQELDEMVEDSEKLEAHLEELRGLVVLSRLRRILAAIEQVACCLAALAGRRERDVGIDAEAESLLLAGIAVLQAPVARAGWCDFEVETLRISESKAGLVCWAMGVAASGVSEGHGGNFQKSGFFSPVHAPNCAPVL
jgi:hypothetical protein